MEAIIRNIEKLNSLKNIRASLDKDLVEILHNNKLVFSRLIKNTDRLKPTNKRLIELYEFYKT